MTHRLYPLLVSLALFPLGALLEAGDIVINEIHYDPVDVTAHEEFVELYNGGASEVDLSAWFFSQGIEYVFPSGAKLAAGGYLVVAEDPAILSARFRLQGVLGPFEGRLRSQGDDLVLRSASGRIEDEVHYSVKFPWPIASAGQGSSMELIHPSLDNDLGGSWLASGYIEKPQTERVYYLQRQDTAWRYRKGTSEASSPTSAWRALEFVEDGTWLTRQTSIGYADNDDNTVLADMQGNYTSVFLRHVFTVPAEGGMPESLHLGYYVDDGFIAWINGVEVARIRVPAGDRAFNATAGTAVEAAWESAELPPPAGYLRVGENVLAIHVFNAQASSTDLSADAELFVPGSEDSGDGGPPTPGRRNSVYSTNSAPQVRQVDHVPLQPPSGSEFLVSAKITDPDGVASVILQYQIVRPGNYIPAFLPVPYSSLLADPYQPPPANPVFESPSSWKTVPMLDDGVGADAIAGDDIYTALIPAQPNRTLVRYRITTSDLLGATTTVPRKDDPSLNFACFVYDGVPAYKTTKLTIRPEGVGYTYPKEAMESLPVYFLITRDQDLTEAIAADPAIWIPQGNDARSAENWEGAFVYEGVVYDHIRYRLRGANGRYQIPSTNPGNVAGKRHWHFRFNRGRRLQARDKWGAPYPMEWHVLNTDRMFGNKLDGNWGLPDMVNDILWNAHGVPSPFGHYFQWRVIRATDEAPAGADGQYLGDFWGVARAAENYDGQFLDAHGLAKGNLYKLVNQTNDPLKQERYQAPDAVSDGSDHNNIENYLRPTQPDAWLVTYVNYEQWNRYHAIAQALRHYDYWPEANKNATWYFEPIYTAENNYLGWMHTFPFDTDATWGPTWNDGRDRPYEAIFGAPGKPEFQKAYRNAIREVRDLLWQPDQLEMIIRQTASFLDALEEADIDRWRNAPAAAGRQYFTPAGQSTLAGKARDMMNFAFVGGNWDGGSVGAGGRAVFLDTLADSPHRTQLPQKPVVTYVGQAGFPIDGLEFETSTFSDPQGSGTFQAMEWRVAEVSPYADPASIPISDPIWRFERVRLEITPVWKSGEIYPFSPRIKIPSTALEPQRVYRVRVRMQDSTNLWSHWSEPVEFVAGPPAAPSSQKQFLRITEIMFNPQGDSEYDFIELMNIGAAPLDLAGVSFTEGIEFSFGSSAVLAPGRHVVIVKDLRVFATRYDTRDILIAGEFGGNLSNAGEKLKLVYGKSQTILDFAYDDAWYEGADGVGYSLVIKDALVPPEAYGSPESWTTSRDVHGSPGRDEPAAPEGLQLPGDLVQDGTLNISDAIGVLGYLFFGVPERLPCGDGSSAHESNLRLVDVNGDREINLSDAVYVLNYLFSGGHPPAGGTTCIGIAECPDICEG